MLSIRLWAILGMVCGSVCAQTSALVADRPGLSNSPSLLERTDFQIESGFYGEKQRAGTFAIIEPGLLFRAGFSNRLELRLRSDGVQISRTPGSARLAGLMDMAMGVKLRLLGSRTSRWNFSLNPELLVPSGATAYSSGRMDPSLRAMLNRRLNSAVSLTWNAYWRLVAPGKLSPGDPRSHLHEYTMAADFPVHGKVSSFIEYYVSRLEGYGRRPIVSMVDTGLVYGLTRTAQVDLSFGMQGPRWNQAPNQPRAYIAIGVILRQPGALVSLHRPVF